MNPLELQSSKAKITLKPASRYVKLAALGLVTTLALTACVTQPTAQKTPDAAATKQAPAEKSAKQKNVNRKDNPAKAVPAKPLTASFVYNYLIAEVAGQRGDFTTSSGLFYELARKEQDARFAERAAKIAAYGRVKRLIYPSVSLWAELDPESIEAQQAITEILIKGNKLDEAEPHLAKLLEKEESRARGFLFIHNILNKSPDKQAVLDITQSLAAPYPALPEAQLSIAQAAAIANKPTVAIDALTKADTLRAGWLPAALLKGQLLFDQSPAAAIDFYQSFLFAHPDKNDVRLNLAKTLVSEGQYDLAKKEFPTIIQYAESAMNKADSLKLGNAHKTAMHRKAEKSLADTTALIGLLAFQGKDYEAANSYLQQALDLNFSDPDQIYLYFGQVAEQQEKYDIAKSWYNRITAGQHFLSAQLNIANVLQTQASVDEAIAFLDGIDHLTKDQQVLVIQTQASMLHQANRHSDAFDLLEKAVKNTPKTPALLYDYALSAERMHKYDIMETQLRKVIKAKPNFAPAYNALGYSFADRGINLKEALTLIQKALELSPNDHFMLDSLGWVYFKQGKLDKAYQYLHQAYTIQQDPEIAAHLGEVLWLQNQQTEALKIWESALNKNPDNAILLATTLKYKR